MKFDMFYSELMDIFAIFALMIRNDLSKDRVMYCNTNTMVFGYTSVLTLDVKFVQNIQ
jgi:hypothetical protein